MRAVLIDWMNEVMSEFMAKRDTFHLAINFVDRYLARNNKVTKSTFQLIGLSAMYLASKIEEIFPKKVSAFVKSADSGYSVQQIFAMERKMMAVLGWRTCCPSHYTWLSWILVQWDSFIKYYYPN